jgi:hypothetical protein
MSTTNDEQSKHGKQPKRVPMLTYAECEYIAIMQALTPREAAKAIRNRYESMIDSGVLMVVKTVKCVNEGKDEAWCEWLRCPCGGSTPVGSKYCPICGAKIIEA